MLLRWGSKLNSEYSHTRQAGASRALHVLTWINFINFADRYVPSAVKELIKNDLNLTDAETALPATGMVIVYMFFAVFFGVLSDKQIVDRRYILFFAVAFWSIATSLAGLSHNLVSLVLIRSLVGVGEAAYGTIAPPLLSDFYPPIDRNVMYGVYYLAIPLGGALGFGIGAVLGSAFGWRVAFYAIGVPGLIVAAFVLTLNDPVRGINDIGDSGDNGVTYINNDSGSGNDNCNTSSTSDGDHSLDSYPLASLTPADKILKSELLSNHKNGGGRSFLEEIVIAWNELMEIINNKHFVCALGGLTANNFALGGLADWYPTFLLRYAPGATLSGAGLVVGAATIIGGIGGNILGAKVASYYEAKKVHSAHFLVSAIFTIPAALFLLLAINITTNFTLMTFLLFLSEIAVWTQLAPMSAVSINVIPPRLRARSCGLLIFVQHVLGDIISPPLIGAISDSTGSLQLALQMTWIAVLISGLWWWVGYYFLIPLNEVIGGVNGENGKSSGPHQKTSIICDNEDGDRCGDGTAPKSGIVEPSYHQLLCGDDPLYVDYSIPVDASGCANVKKRVRV